MTILDDHGDDGGHGSGSGEADVAVHAATAESVAPGAMSSRTALTGLLDELGRAGERQTFPPTPVRFTYTLDPRNEHVDVNCDRPFDPVTTRRVALKVVALCDDHGSGWRGLLRKRGRTVPGFDPVGFTVTYDPQTRMITVNPDAGCTLRLLRHGAADVARVCHEAASPN
jgi:hypothetical protein